MQDLTAPVVKNVTLSLDVLTLTVSVHAAVGEDKTAYNTTVCTTGDHATPIPVTQTLGCPHCKNTDKSTFEKARKVAGGLVVIPQEVLDQEKAAAQQFASRLELTVHPADEVTSVLLPSGKSYYLSMIDPVPAMVNAYTVLSRMIASRPDRAFMTKMTMRTATTLFQLTVAGEGTLVLRQMADAELVRRHPRIDFTDMSQRAIELVSGLADDLTTPFLEGTHGTGKSQIISQYVLEQTPVPLTALPSQASIPADVTTVHDFTAHLAEVVAARQAENAKPAKKKAARKITAGKVAV